MRLVALFDGHAALLTGHAALLAESLRSLAQLVSLLAQPSYRLGIQACLLLQGRGPLLGSQLEFPLLLHLGQEVEGPLASLGVLLE